MKRFFLSAILLVYASITSAQILIEDPMASSRPRLGDGKFRAQNQTPDSEGFATQPPAKTGKSAATDYFKKRSGESTTPNRSYATGGSDHVMGLSVGTFINDTQHRWGARDKTDDVGELMLGVTYRVGEWTSSMDMNFRAEIMSYDIDGETPVKLSVMPFITFPDARSEFPLYFGAGIGAGVFFEQAEDESDLSLDYTLAIGARFMDLFENGGGLFAETGVKGLIHILSSGQHDGVYLSGGALFAF